MAKSLKRLTSIALAGALIFGMAAIDSGVVDAATTTKSTTSSSSTYKSTTTTASNNQSAKNQLTQQLNANTTFTTSQKVDIQKAIDNGILKGVGTSKTTVEAQLDRQATAAEAAAFLLRSVGQDVGNGSNFYNEMQSHLKNLGVNIDAKKEVSAADVNKIAQAVAQTYGKSNLAAFNSSSVAQYASDGNISRGELLLLLTTTTPSSSSSTSKTTSTSSSSTSSGSSYSSGSYSYSYSYSSGGSSYTPKPKPATVVISPATTHLQDTPAEFKNNPNAKAVEPNRKYGANVIEQLKQEIVSGKTTINFADKYNNWAAQLFGVK